MAIGIDYSCPLKISVRIMFSLGDNSISELIFSRRRYIVVDTFWLILTYACNNRCEGCYADSSGFTDYMMPMSFAEQILEKMSSLGVKKCLLIGGEPTLYPDLQKIIKLAYNLGIKTTLVTNGRKLASTLYLDKMLAAGLSKLVISIEGSKETIHNSITKRNSFKQTLGGIKNSISVGYEVCTLTTIQEANKVDCELIPEYLYRLGVKEIAFNCSIPSIVAHLSSVEHLSPSEISTTIERVFKRARQEEIPVNFNATIPACLFSEDILKSMLEHDAIAFGCQMYRGRGVAFEPSGNILPCTHFTGFPLYEGKLSSGGQLEVLNKFEAFWDSEKVNQFREQLWKFPSRECQTCCWWGGCIGGCPIFWLHFDPRDYILCKSSQERRC